MGCNNSRDKFLLQEIDRLNRDLKVARIRYKYLAKHYGVCKNELKRIQEQHKSLKRKGSQADEENSIHKMNCSESTYYNESSIDQSELITIHQAEIEHYKQLLTYKDRLIHKMKASMK